MKKIKNKLLSVFSGKVTKNVGWIVFQNVYTMILSLIVTGLVARHFGTSGYGIINFALSFVALFSFIAVFGTNHIIVKDLVSNEYDASVILGSNLFIRIILSILSLIISQTIALVFYSKSINLAIFLFSINVIISSSDVITYYAQSKIQNKHISLSKMISTTIFSILKILTIVLNLNIYYLIATYIIENLIYTVLLVISYRKIRTENIGRWKINKIYLKQLLKRSKYYALSTLMVTIYLRIDQVMLGSIFEDKSIVGIYSSAVRISEIWTFIPLAVITAFKPIIFKSKKNSEVEYKNNLQKLYNIISSICFSVLILIICFGKLSIYILYGNAYISAYIPLIILTIGIWLGVLGNIHYIWMTCENKEKYSLLYSFMGSVVNIIFNLILIPRYNILGAAIATTISQIFSNILAFLLIKNTRIMSIMLLKSLNPILGLKQIIFKSK